jgi:hypothetical protein
MTSEIWQAVSLLALDIEYQFKLTGEPVSDHDTSQYNWYNAIYSSNRYRRAHIEIVDNRDTHRIYILHCTIFPHFNDSAPIWGFDVVCGPNKITGAFHDFSLPGYDNHAMSLWWEQTAKQYSWSKNRNLPEWARSIFSPYMIAAGNISSSEEVNNLCNLARTSLEYYLKNVGNSQESGAEYHERHNFYCRKQKQNPHVINSMVAMGVPKETMQTFVNQVLFPETY